MIDLSKWPVETLIGPGRFSEYMMGEIPEEVIRLDVFDGDGFITIAVPLLEYPDTPELRAKMIREIVNYNPISYEWF